MFPGLWYPETACKVPGDSLKRALPQFFSKACGVVFFLTQLRFMAIKASLYLGDYWGSRRGPVGVGEGAREGDRGDEDDQSTWYSCMNPIILYNEWKKLESPFLGERRRISPPRLCWGARQCGQDWNSDWHSWARQCRQDGNTDTAVPGSVDRIGILRWCVGDGCCTECLFTSCGSVLVRGALL